MKNDWKKAVLLSIFCVVALFITLYSITFNTLDMTFLNGRYEYIVPTSMILDGAKDYEINDNVWKAISDDAWIMVSLPEKEKVKAVQIDLDLVKYDEATISQIYYSSEGEILGDAYVETRIDSGINRIIIDDKPLLLSTLRLDLTSYKNESFIVNDIRIVYSSEKIIVFWFSFILFGISVTFFSFVYFCKPIIGNWISRKDKRLKLYHSVQQVISLAVSDFKSRFSGSYLGIFWGIIQPISTIFLFWFVFQIGFRSNPIEGVPFILWLSAGMIPWNYFYDSWFGGTNSFTSYNYIVKKVVFDVELLPLVKILSSAILNFIFNIILLLIYLLYGRFPGYHIYDMVYFSFCILCYSLGLSYITASLNVFIKDIGQFLGIVLQFLMWLTPMMWDYHMLEEYSWFYKFNPLHYVINGYREAMIDGEWFFTHWVQMVWFWTVTLACLIGGKRLMRNLKKHFADVL